MIRKALSLLTLTTVITACGGPEEADFRDRSGPSVIEVVPADGSTDVPIDVEVEIKFSESILVRKKLSGNRLEEFDFGGFVATGPDGKQVTGFITFNNDSLIFRPAEGLEHGAKYSFSVNERVKDLFGNPAKPFSWSFETEADQVAPTAPYNIIYPTLTNQSSVVIEGSMDPASTLLVNGKTATKHPKNGVFKHTVSLTEGDNAFTFSAVDDAGNESANVEVTITRDSTPPAALATCAAGVLKWHYGLRSGCWNPPATLHWNKPNLPVGAEWSPGPNEVAYFMLGNQTAPACTTGLCEHEFQPKSAGSGAVKLRAYSIDQAGNQRVAFERALIFDDQPPGLSLASALPPIFKAPQLGLSATTTTVTAGSLTFTKESGARYFASIDGAPAAACADTVTSCTLAYSGLADGVHRFAVTATDAAGNETRLTKFVTIDTRAPRVYMLPGTGSTPSGTPTFHVFADEPVTTSTLVLTAEALTPVSDPVSRNRHWTFSTPTQALAAAETAVVSVYDAAGNRTVAGTTFSTTGGYPVPATAYAGMTTGGTGRDANVTLTGLTASFTVALVNDGGKAGTYALTVTTGATLALTLDPLSRVIGAVHAYDDNGDVAEFALLPADPWNHGAPAVSATVSDARTAVYGPNFATVLPITGGFGYFTDSGYAYWFDGLGGNPEGDRLDFMTGCYESIGHLYPTLFALDSYWALTGKPCDARDAGVSVVSLTPGSIHAGTTWPLWSPPDAGDYLFGAAITGAPFFGDAHLQFAVGSPNGDGSVYLYDATTAASPSYRLIGDDSAHAKFGDSIAFAGRHHAGKNALAVIAPDEPAVYFFDQDIYTNEGADPLGLYRVRAPLQTNACHASFNGRHEVVNVGNLDGDADNSDDFIVAVWPEGCIGGEVILNVFLGGQGAAGADPVVMRQSFDVEYNSQVLPRVVPLGDLNADGRADFGFAESSGGSMARVFYGTRHGKPESRLVYAPASVPAGWWVLGGTTDVDGDARPDLILSVQSSTGSSRMLLSRP